LSGSHWLNSAGSNSSSFCPTVSDIATVCDVFYGLLGLAVVLAAAVAILRTRQHLLQVSLGGWLLLAIVLSDSVWGRPNNAIRVLAPMWTLVAITIGASLSTAGQPSPAPPLPTGSSDQTA
jgi:hypothetical protein